MQKFVCHEGLAVPLDAANVDTDQIIPKQFLQAVSRQGFGKHLFRSQFGQVPQHHILVLRTGDHQEVFRRHHRQQLFIGAANATFPDP